MRKKQKLKAEYPSIYKMKNFPLEMDFYIPSFDKNNIPGSEKTLALSIKDCGEWYHEFIDKCIAACGHQYLPIYRMSDGEFLFVLGEQDFDVRLSFFEKTKLRLSNLKTKLVLNNGVGTWTEGHYHSGEYSFEEWQVAKQEQPGQIKEISEKGILALHLSFVHEPFAEHYWPALDKWIDKHRIMISEDNYYPFYFVYAMLTGSRRSELLEGRRILVVNGAVGEKKQKIINGLKKEGVAKVEWCSISLNRSMFDIINVEPFVGKIDLALVGAGIAKPHILLQMEQLNVPCIDAGFIFEVWADTNNRWKRSYTGTDDDYEKVKKK